MALPSGLKQWVRDYKTLRKTGNVRLAKQVKANIDRQIKNQKLSASKVYGSAGRRGRAVISRSKGLGGKGG